MALGDAFSDQFDARRGDLVYGRSDFRSAYLNEARKVFPKEWLIVDDYNNASILGANAIFVSDPGGVRPIAYVAAGDFDATTGVENIHDVKGYLDRLYAHPKYNPYRTLAAPEDKIAREHGRSPEESVEWLMIRRACKFGIEWIVGNGGGAQIHFVLDGLDMDAITRKEAVKIGQRVEAATPITTSELCSVYRRWARPGFAQRVAFYEAMRECRPPWENPTHAAAWRKYGAARYEKHLQRCAAALEAGLYSPHDAKWENKARAAVTALEKAAEPGVKAGRFYEAVDALHAYMAASPAPRWRADIA